MSLLEVLWPPVQAHFGEREPSWIQTCKRLGEKREGALRSGSEAKHGGESTRSRANTDNL